MKKFDSLDSFDEHDRVYVRSILQLIASAVETKQPIQKKRMERYVDLLNDLKNLLEENEPTIVFERQTFGRVHKEVLDYIDELKKALYGLMHRELVQNQEFRTKNLRGAKVEDLYFEVYEALQASFDEFEPLQGFIDGKDVLHFIEENFDYFPLYKSSIKQEGEVLDEQFVIYMREIENEQQLISELNRIATLSKKIYIVAKNEKELFSKNKGAVFKWIKKQFGGIEQFKGYQLSFACEHKEEQWQTLHF